MQIANVTTNGYLLNFELNWLVVILLISIVIVVYGIIYFAKNKKFNKERLEMTALSLDIQGSKIEYEVKRNYQNLEIAHKIFVELITRKAAIPFDEENDVIYDVYNSWYSLFKVIRKEIKNISGETLFHHEESDDLVKMATDILNKGLRPHLTKHQAKFRKWYENELTKNTQESPQDIQKRYPDYAEILTDMKKVNEYLIQYAKQLKKFIGESKKSN
jgi:hypothetical protein